MANKTITELQLVGAVTDDLSVPSDNGIQSYRFTIAQLVAYILANNSITQAMLQDGIVDTAELKDSFIHGLTGVTPLAGDYVPIADASDSNNKKKASVASLRNAVYRSVTTTDSVGADDETMKLSGASFTSTLPTAVGIEGKRYKFLHAGTSLTQVYTLATTSSQTIGGVAGGSYALYTNGEVLEIESDGANWIIVGRQSNSGWASYTPTLVGFGTCTNVSFRWRRIGQTCEIEGSWTTGTVAGTGATVSFPTNVTSSSSYRSTEVSDVCGTAAGGAALVSLLDPSATTCWFGYSGAGVANLTKQNGNAISNSSAIMSMRCRVRVDTWQP